MKKRLLSFALAAVMTFSSLALSACNPSTGVDGKPGKGARTTKDLTNVYKADSVSTLGTVFENLQINTVYPLTDGKLLVAGYDTDSSQDKYYITDFDFQNASEMMINKTEGKNTETYVQNVLTNPTDGSIWYIKNTYTYTEDPHAGEIEPRASTVETATGVNDLMIAVEDNMAVEPDVGYDDGSGNINKYYLVKVDSDGNIVSETDISDELMVTDEDGNSYMSYLNNMVFGGGKLMFCVESTVKLFHPDTVTKDQEFKLTDQYIDNLYVGASGAVYYVVWGDKGQMLYQLDVTTGKSEETNFDGIGNLYNYSFSTGTNGYEFILTGQDGISGYTPGDAAPTEICSFTNSDIDMSNGNASPPILLEDGRILLCFYDYETNQNDILLLSKVDPSMVKEKYVITAAGRYIDYQIKRTILKFNRTNDQYKVIFKDYSQYDTPANDYNGAYEALDKDLLSKNDAPDLLFIDSYGMDYMKYISKGMFADLEVFMDADEAFHKADYLENVFEAAKINGHLYTLAPSISIMTLAGKKSLYGDKTHWTMKEFMEMHRSLGKDEQMLPQSTRDGYGSLMLMIAQSECIDKDGNCTFDSQDFKDILAYLKDLPEDYNAYQDQWQENENYWEQQELSYSRGTTKLYPAYIYNFDMLPEIEAYLGEEATLIGYPTNKEGATGAMIQSNSEISINANSKVKEGCWEVVKYLLSDEFQNMFSGDRGEGRRYGGSYQFPVKKSIIEKKMKNDLLPMTYTEYDEDGNEIEVEQERYTWIGDTKVEKRKSTQEDVSRLYDIIAKANFYVRQDKNLNEIIMNEAQPYFDNQKSVDEVVSVINSRVRLYVSQQR